MENYRKTSATLTVPAGCRPIHDRYWLLGFVLVCILSLFPLLLIITNGVRVPFRDEWGLLGLTRENATFDTFWTPNNEHRLLFPNLVFSILIKLTSWNSVSLMIASWVGIAATALFLLYCFGQVLNNRFPRLWLVTVVFSILLFLSPVQRENWLWGYQLAFFFVTIGVVLSLFSMTFTTIAYSSRLALALAFAVFASFSSAQGLMVWPALLVTLSLTKDPTRCKLSGFLLTSVAMVIVCLIYFANYHAPTYGHLQLDKVFRAPQTLIWYFLGLLGAPLTFWATPGHLRTSGSIIVGCLLLLLLIYFSYLNLKECRKGEAAPWIGLAVFSVAFCGITTYGRGEFGIDIAVLFSRYTTHELLLSVAVMASGYLALSSYGGVRRPLRPIFFSLFLSGAGICIVLGYIDGFSKVASENESRRQAKELFPFLKYFDPRTDGEPTGPLYILLQLPGTKVFDVWYKPYAERYINAIKNAEFIHSYSGLVGRCSVSIGGIAPGQALTASGAVRVPLDKSPNYVFLKEQGKDTFISAAKLEVEKHDAGGRIYDWNTTLAPQLLQDPRHELEMWIYDRTSNAFLKVDQGADTVPVVLRVHDEAGHPFG
jgi:hypothetical protein